MLIGVIAYDRKIKVILKGLFSAIATKAQMFADQPFNEV